MKCEEAHKWRFQSFYFMAGSKKLPNDWENFDCDRPNRLVCERCQHGVLIKCKSLKDSQCVPCSLRAKADKKLVMRSGLLRSPMGWIELTLTAPGAAKLPWDKSKCNHLPGIKCSGKIGCKPDEVDSALFNGSMPKNWNRYVQAVRRLFGVEVQYGKVFEAQARDLLHVHALIVGAPAWPLHRINKELRRLAVVHGLGREISVKRVMGDSPLDRQRAIGYVGKYLTKGSKTLKTVNLRTGELKVGGYRDFTQSRHFGETLKSIREARLMRYRLANGVDEARIAEAESAKAEGSATATGDEVALDIYKKSYTLIE